MESDGIIQKLMKIDGVESKLVFLRNERNGAVGSKLKLNALLNIARVAKTLVEAKAHSCSRINFERNMKQKLELLRLSRLKTGRSND